MDPFIFDVISETQEGCRSHMYMQYIYKYYIYIIYIYIYRMLIEIKV